MRTFVLSLAFVVIASCKPGDRAVNTNSVAPPANEKSSAADAGRKEPCINLNTASPDQLIKLPGIGDVMAKKIIDYRERHGRFRRPEEIIIIEGFSEQKYRAIAGMICVE